MKFRDLCLVAAVGLASPPAFAADMIETYQQPTRQVAREYHRQPVAYVQTRHVECNELLIEYRYYPRSELVQVCHPPIF